MKLYMADFMDRNTTRIKFITCREEKCSAGVLVSMA
jgi:hypothetical protein